MLTPPTQLLSLWPCHSFKLPASTSHYCIRTVLLALHEALPCWHSTNMVCILSNAGRSRTILTSAPMIRAAANPAPDPSNRRAPHAHTSQTQLTTRPLPRLLIYYQLSLQIARLPCPNTSTPPSDRTFGAPAQATGMVPSDAGRARR